MDTVVHSYIHTKEYIHVMYVCVYSQSIDRPQHRPTQDRKKEGNARNMRPTATKKTWGGGGGGGGGGTEPAYLAVETADPTWEGDMDAMEDGGGQDLGTGTAAPPAPSPASPGPAVGARRRMLAAMALALAALLGAASVLVRQAGRGYGYGDGYGHDRGPGTDPRPARPPPGPTRKHQAGLPSSAAGEEEEDEPHPPFPPFPPELLGGTDGGPYDGAGADFVNSAGRTPAYWDEVRDLRKHGAGAGAGAEAGGGGSWGPCMPPDPADGGQAAVNWTEAVQRNRQRVDDDHLPPYPDPGGPLGPNARYSEREVAWGMCRPGFVIIGAGKCGTSSLYHYLVGHDRVLPAREKQIHYFKYYAQRSMSWYLSHFPSTETFLGSGALMTGEASPGYLPYGNVARITADRLPGPRIVVAAREPLDRAWSSYRYSYVVPALERAMKGRAKERGVPKGMTEDYYRENHLFSFEEMVRAELRVLRECLRPGGGGEQMAWNAYGGQKWAREEFQRRKEAREPPLIDLADHCYGDSVSKDVPRAQWSDLVRENPEKIIRLPSLHLVESFVGRGLYVLPLEWWYITYPAEDIYLVCNEDMRDDAVNMLSDLSGWLGLPDFDFTDVVAEGMYNVGGHRGYDEATPWDEVDGEVDGDASDSDDNSSDSGASSDGEGGTGHHNHEEIYGEIPISDELKEELLNFVRPFNERLFELTGQRCNWL